MNSAFSILIALPSLFAAADPAAGEVRLLPFEPHFRIEISGVVLTDTPVHQIVITARDADGKLDESFNGRPVDADWDLDFRRLDE